MAVTIGAAKHPNNRVILCNKYVLIQVLPNQHKSNKPNYNHHHHTTLTRSRLEHIVQSQTQLPNIRQLSIFKNRAVSFVFISGEIDDPFNEFFIESRSGVEIERMWHDKYRVR